MTGSSSSLGFEGLLLFYSSRDPPTPPRRLPTHQGPGSIGTSLSSLFQPQVMWGRNLSGGSPESAGRCGESYSGPSHGPGPSCGDRSGHHSSVHEGPAAASATVDWFCLFLDSVQMESSSMSVFALASFKYLFGCTGSRPSCVNSLVPACGI